MRKDPLCAVHLCLQSAPRGCSVITGGHHRLLKYPDHDMLFEVARCCRAVHAGGAPECVRTSTVELGVVILNNKR